MIRALVVIGLLIFAAFLPQMAVVALAALAIFMFPNFWEAVLIGLFLDALYGASIPRFLGFQFIYTLALCVALLVLEQLKKSVRVYRRDLAV